MRYLLIICFILILPPIAFEQEIPKIVSYSPLQYGALNQNWSIAQGCDGNIYVANTKGVLIFNGLRWKLLRLPNDTRPRSVYKGRDCRMYVSGYEAFGFIDLEDPEKPRYKPIASSELMNRDQEYWRIFGDSSRLIIQSFSEVYEYDYESLSQLKPPGNIMLGQFVEGRLILPKIENGLFEIKNKNIIEIQSQKPLPSGSKVVGITEDGLYATQNHGLFQETSEGFEKIDSDLNRELEKKQINSILKTRNNQYIIGTILDGIYISKDLISIDYHVNKANGLSNNTVLSLIEDSHGNVWCGLDKGIDLIKIEDPLRFYYDKKGQLGSVFTSIFYRGDLYLGTNQGVFKQSRNGEFKLLDDSQGQVWSFLIADGDLLCGHNKGTFLINNESFTQISPITGGWCMKKITERTVLQSSYTGMVLFEKDEGQWSSGFRIEGGERLVENFEILDHSLVGYHPHYGLNKMVFSDDFKMAMRNEYLKDQKVSEPIIIPSDQGFIIKSVSRSSLISLPDSKPLRSDTLKFDPSIHSMLDYAKALQVIEKTEQVSNRRFNKPQSQRDQNIVGFNEGYIIFPSIKADGRGHSIVLDYVLVNRSLLNLQARQSIELKPKENDISFQFRSTGFEELNSGLKYRLDGWDDEWFPFPKDGLITFNNLQDGYYRLQLSGAVGDFSFRILPKWYESYIGFLLYVGLAFLIVLFFNKRQNIKLKNQEAKLNAEKQKELESERIKAKNAELENVVDYKNKMLANSTITLVQKNKLLIDLKSTLSKELKNTDPEKRRQILHLIEMSINSDDDWELFESTFAEVHDDFIENLRDKHPNITQGELRLAAYIKMDLSSKEIAPLMNISVRSIENKRYRLRKKFEIDDQSLKKYLQNL